MCEITKAINQLQESIKEDIKDNEVNLKEFVKLSLKPIIQSGIHTTNELKKLNSKVADHERRMQEIEKDRRSRATDCPNLQNLKSHDEAIQAINNYIKTKDAVEAEREKNLIETAAALEKKTARRLYVLFGVSALVISVLPYLIEFLKNLLKSLIV